MRQRIPLRLGVLMAAMVMTAWPLASAWTRAQSEEGEQSNTQAKDGRFEFEVVVSFDEKYEGDTPGHIGRGGGLALVRPNVALKDAVYRGDAQVGTITGVTWDRARGSLEIEFDPSPNVRVAVGDLVWIALDGRAKPSAS